MESSKCNKLTLLTKSWTVIIIFDPCSDGNTMSLTSGMEWEGVEGQWYYGFIPHSNLIII